VAGAILVVGVLGVVLWPPAHSVQLDCVRDICGRPMKFYYPGVRVGIALGVLGIALLVFLILRSRARRDARRLGRSARMTERHP